MIDFRTTVALKLDLLNHQNVRLSALKNLQNDQINAVGD